MGDLRVVVMHRAIVVAGVVLASLGLGGCGSAGNESNAEAPPMGEVVPVEGSPTTPPPIVTDSSAYAEQNVDTSGRAR